MISCLTSRAFKSKDCFCPGSTTSSLIKLLKSTRPFIDFVLVFLFFLFSFFLLSLSIFWSIESFVDCFLRFFGFLTLSSILVSFFLFPLALAFSSFFGGFLSVLTSPFTFFFFHFFSFLFQFFYLLKKFLMVFFVFSELDFFHLFFLFLILLFLFSWRQLSMTIIFFSSSFPM